MQVAEYHKTLKNNQVNINQLIVRMNGYTANKLTDIYEVNI